MTMSRREHLDRGATAPLFPQIKRDRRFRPLGDTKMSLQKSSGFPV